MSFLFVVADRPGTLGAKHVILRLNLRVTVVILTQISFSWTHQLLIAFERIGLKHH